MIYYIGSKSCSTIRIVKLQVPFISNANWVFMNENEIFIGCGFGQTSFDKYGKGKGKHLYHRFYSIINVKTRSAIKTGKMSMTR